jgi:hypothetical protein
VVEVALHACADDQDRRIGAIDDVPHLVARAQIGIAQDRVRESRPVQGVRGETVDHHDRPLVRIVIIEQVKSGAAIDLFTAHEAVDAEPTQRRRARAERVRRRRVGRERIALVAHSDRAGSERIGNHQVRHVIVSVARILDPRGCAAIDTLGRQQLAGWRVLATWRADHERHAEAKLRVALPAVDVHRDRARVSRHAAHHSVDNPRNSISNLAL